jgi:hypothetical protein
MNLRQKLVYTGFGALLTVIGMGFASVVSPPLIAQKAAGEIVCTKLTVVDETGQPAIILVSYEGDRSLSIMDKERESGIILALGEKDSSLFFFDEARNARANLGLNETGGYLSIGRSEREDKGGVLLGVREGTGIVMVADRHGQVVGHLPDSPNVR